VPAYITKDAGSADVVITLKAHSRKEPARLREASSGDVPVYVVKSNTYTQIANVVRSIFRVSDFGDEDAALSQARTAIERILDGDEDHIELMPQTSYVRRLQHQLAGEHGLVSESIGTEPYRHVRISRP